MFYTKTFLFQRQLKDKISVVEAADARDGKAKKEKKAKSLLERL